MRQAIVTKYLPPTNHKGGRIKASAQAGDLIVNWRHEWNVEENHIHAARKLAEKWEWTGNWAGGALPTGGFAFVLDIGRGFVIEPSYERDACGDLAHGTPWPSEVP